MMGDILFLKRKRIDGCCCVLLGRLRFVRKKVRATPFSTSVCVQGVVGSEYPGDDGGMSQQVIGGVAAA